MIAVLILLLVFVAFCLLFPVFTEDRTRPKIYLASEDDAALHEHFVRAEKWKVDELRHTREASRRRYEGITWPAICWELRKREMERYLPAMRDAP